MYDAFGTLHLNVSYFGIWKLFPEGRSLLLLATECITITGVI